MYSVGVLDHFKSPRNVGELADATALMPLDFTRMLWASLLGYLLFGEIPGLWTWVGGTIIFCSAAYITLREAKSGTPAAAETVN